mmetsp:Transcript_7172/g.10914  ORF Transcript_7172/g.10914 Transcript_7172/m.10914 type:complete len:894 (+) Transcript_7172:103-2784(+)
MTNAGSTIISPLTMTTIDRNLRSTSKKELEHSGQCGGTSVEEDAALVNAENDIHLSHDEEINSLDSNGNPIVDAEKVENRMLTVALVNSVVQSSASTSSSDLNKKGKGEETEEDTQSKRYSLRKRTRSFAGSNSGGEESTHSESNKTSKTDADDKPHSPRSPGGSRISKCLQTKTLEKEEQLQQSQPLPQAQSQSQSQSESNAQPQSQSQTQSQSQPLPQTQSQTLQEAQAPADVAVTQPTIPTAPAPPQPAPAPVPPPPVLPIKVDPPAAVVPAPAPVAPAPVAPAPAPVAPAPVAPAPVAPAPVAPAPVAQAQVVRAPVVQAQAPPQVRIQAPPIKVEMRPPQPNPVAVNDPTRVPNPLLGMSTSPVAIPQNLGTVPTTTAAAPLLPQTTTVNTAAVLPQQQNIIKTEIPSTKMDPSSSSSIPVPPPATVAPLAPAPPVACPLPAQPAPSMQVTVKVEEATLPVKQEEQVIQRRGRIFSIDIDPAGLDFPDLGIVDAMNQQSELSSSAPLPPISSTVSGGGVAPPPLSHDHSHSQYHQNGIHNAPPPAPHHPHAHDIPPIETKTEPSPAPPSMLPDDMDVNTDFLTGGRDRAMSFEFFSFGINADEPLPPAPELLDHSGGGRPRGDSIIFDPCSFRDGGVLEEGFLMKSRGNSIDIGVTEEMNIMNTPGFIPAPASGSHHDPNSHTNSHLAPADHSASLPPPPAVPSTNGSYILPSQTVPAPPPAVHAPPRAPPLSSVPAPLGTTTTTTTTNSYGTTTTTTTTTTVTGATAKSMGVPGGGGGGGVVAPTAAAATATAGGTTNVQMATLPSSLSGSSMSHSTFQMELLNKDGRIGIYLPEARKARIAKFHSKRKMRIWRKRIKYDCRKKLADSRPRIKGRFVKRSDMEEDEE